MTMLSIEKNSSFRANFLCSVVIRVKVKQTVKLYIQDYLLEEVTLLGSILAFKLLKMLLIVVNAAITTFTGISRLKSQPNMFWLLISTKGKKMIFGKK